MAAEVNGSSGLLKEEEEPMDVTATHSENYQTLLDAGLPQKVAEGLDNIFQTGETSGSERSVWSTQTALNHSLRSVTSVLLQSSLDG